MRKGGNPDLEKFKYECKIDTSPAETLSVRVSPGTKELLKEKFGAKSSDKVREAIAKLLQS